MSYVEHNYNAVYRTQFITSYVGQNYYGTHLTIFS